MEKSNPYKGANDFQFWSRAVTWLPVGMIDPVTSSYKIENTDRIGTMGSCFAQHISKHLSQVGCNYFVSETTPPYVDPSEGKKKNYGIFSARYGNIYTVKQAVQLFHRAFKNFAPIELFWPRGTRFVDPFRPQIEPEGFATAEEVILSRDKHLECVRNLFENADCLIFTLGLTEAWRDKRDGAIYPLAPGVAGGQFDSSIHEFINFDVNQTRDDLSEFISLLASVNPRCKVILTISPVPLIATYENRHVICSTSYSKSVLRVAAEEMAGKHANVFYFPSYELITSSATCGTYFQDDLRQVREEGIRHVMKVFFRHFLIRNPDHLRERHAETTIAQTFTSGVEIVCDEEILERALSVNT